MASPCLFACIVLLLSPSISSVLASARAASTVVTRPHGVAVQCRLAVRPRDPANAQARYNLHLLQQRGAG
jgi:hypothetical protein